MEGPNVSEKITSDRLPGIVTPKTKKGGNPQKLPPFQFILAT